MRATWLVHLYPERWRARYEDEFQALLEAEPATPSLIVDVIRGALVAHASPQDRGGIPMRSRAPVFASVLAVLLVLPAVTFLAAAMIRAMQPTAYQPARAAAAIFGAFAALPHDWMWVVLVIAPVGALVLSLLVTWRRWSSDLGAREDVAALASGLRRIAHQPILIAAAFASLASAGVLLFMLGHALAG